MDFYDSNESDRTFYRSPKEMLHGLSQAPLDGPPETCYHDPENNTGRGL